MKESIVSKKALAVMFGCLFIGGLAAIIGIYRKARDTESSPYYV